MPIHEHHPNSRGRAFLWGGLGLGLLFLALVLTRGFGLLGGRGKGQEEPVLMIRQGDKIIVPEGSALRGRLSVVPASAQAVSAKLVLPGVVEADPARTAAVLTPVSGRVTALKVALGDRVQRGQVLATVDSPDLGQAYDDDDKAADTLRLTEKNLARQEAQNKLGTASDRDLDQARSDHAQAVAEYTRTQARLKMLGAPLGKGQSSRLLAVTAPVSGSVTALATSARQYDQRSHATADDHRGLEHRMGHGDGAEKDVAARLQESGAPRSAFSPIPTECCTARSCSYPM